MAESRSTEEENVGNGKSRVHIPTLNDFRYREGIGEGGHGKVVLVSTRLSANMGIRRLALKQMSKTLIYDSAYPEIKAKFIMEEKRILQELQGAPFIIQMVCTFQSPSHMYFLTELYPRGSLHEYMQRANDIFRKGNANIKKNNKDFPLAELEDRLLLSEREFTLLAAELTVAICYLHEKNIMHRDLKPQNIVLDKNGHIRIIDFGLACHKTDPKLSWWIVGTPAYRAPETFSLGVYNEMVDWWALGVTLLTTLLGKNPFEEEEEGGLLTAMKYFVIQNYLPVGRYCKNACSFIQELMAVDPIERLGTMREKRHVKNHALFQKAGLKSVADWEKVARLERDPPLPPETYSYLKPLEAKWIQLEEEQEPTQTSPLIESVLEGFDSVPVLPTSCQCQQTLAVLVPHPTADISL